jgi:hypothetical protein
VPLANGRPVTGFPAQKAKPAGIGFSSAFSAAGPKSLLCLAESREKHGMVTAVDLIEDWIEMRSKLQRQLKVLEAGEMYRGDNISDSTTTATVARLVSELNELLKEYGRTSTP